MEKNEKHFYLTEQQARKILSDLQECQDINRLNVAKATIDFKFELFVYELKRSE